jgi:hypothetical protein
MPGATTLGKVAQQTESNSERFATTEQLQSVPG